jgi:threonine aldolase
MTGMEAGLFVCSGVMGNQLCLRTHVTENTKSVVQQAVIIDDRSHVHKYELGGLAFHSGTMSKILTADKAKGHLTVEQIEKAIYLGSFNQTNSKQMTIYTLLSPQLLVSKTQSMASCLILKKSKRFHN